VRILNGVGAIALVWAYTNAAAQELPAVDLTQPAPFPDLVQGFAAPPLRDRAQVESILTAEPTEDAAELTQCKIVLCASEKDPGHRQPGFHDYPLWRARWSALLKNADGVQVETADRWPDADQWATADVIVFYHDNPAWDADKAADLDRLLARGGGLVFLHWSVNAHRDFEPLAARLGRAWGEGATYRQGPLELEYAEHPITRGFTSVNTFLDEPYGNLPGPASGLEVLALSNEPDGPQPQVWLRSAQGGRVFVCLPGHFTWTLDDPIYRILVFRGICWAADQPLGRLDGCVVRGARISN
jgi:hypothetical protein